MHKQKIAELKEIREIEGRLYTYADCVTMMASIMRETEAKYNVRYSLCLATALSAPPYNFDSEKTCGIIKLFFEQIEALQIGTIQEIDIKEEAEKLGVVVIDDGKTLTVDINPILNKTKGEMIMEPTSVSKTEYEAAFIKSKCAEMVDQFKAKNEAYGDSFGKTVQKYGPISALTRMSDKWNRIEALILGADNKVGDERLEDTLVDMACYCLMTLYELDMIKIKDTDKSQK